MVVADQRFPHAQSVADALLYEGYVLYPYRASSTKNQNKLRWQFGVLVPPGYRTGDEPSTQRTECLLQDTAGARISLRLRFLRVQSRTVEAPGEDGHEPCEHLVLADGEELIPWDEAVEERVDAIVPLDDLVGVERDVVFTIPAGTEVEPVTVRGGRTASVIRSREPIEGRVRLTAERLDTEPGSVRLSVTVENTSAWARDGAARDEALRHSLIGTHVMLAVDGGSFVSLLEAPPWAASAAATCESEGAFPVLVGAPGSTDTVLCSPILVYDYPRVAPESPGDLYDATEIDEILTLRTLTLTEEEKREARATDARSAAIIDRVETMSPDVMRGLHGTIRERSDRMTQTPAAGTKVRLRLGRRRADVHDIIYDGRVATVWDAVVDSEGQHMVKVTIDDDPAADIHREQGRYLYFAMDETEPIGALP